MKSRSSRILFTIFLAGSLAVFALPGSAQDGPIRQRLKEWAMERQQQKTRPDVSATTEAKPLKPGDHSFTIEKDGLIRMYRVHVPSRFSAATPAPLLLAFHGGGGNMDYQASDEHYGLIKKSGQEGFIVVFPNGYSKRKSGKLATWNAGKCCGSARDENSDDVKLVRQIIANVTAQVNIDRNRIYATGMSNGAMLAYRLACEMSDVFKGIAAVAGTDNTLECKPDHPISILHIHAENDTHVLFAGGAGPGLRNKSLVTDFTSVADTVSKWVRLNHCSARPQRILEKTGAYCDLYSPCQGNTHVQLCVTETGGHSWPGAEKSRGEAASHAISANDMMWGFFNR